MLRNEIKRLKFLTNEQDNFELYSNLLDPAFEQIRDSYIQVKTKEISNSELLSLLCEDICKGILFGSFKAASKTALKNTAKDYKKQRNKVPYDLFLIKNYTNFGNYPNLLRGFLPDAKVEVSYQITNRLLGTVAKSIIRYDNLDFSSKIGIDFGRSFCTSFLTATTIYPLAQALYTEQSTEQIIRKTIKRASIGAFIYGVRSVGISLARSMLPSYNDTLSVLIELID